MPWKKHNAYSIRLKIGDLLHDSKNSGSQIGSLRYERVMLERRPFGGSFVILMPFCRTTTGKCSAGYDVNHSRKSGWVVSDESDSQIRSSVDIQLFAKWLLKSESKFTPKWTICQLYWFVSAVKYNENTNQFWSTTHVPVLVPSSIILTAIGPWPWPAITPKTLAFMLTLILFSSHLKTARKVYCQILDRQQTSAKPMWDQLLQKKKKRLPI